MSYLLSIALGPVQDFIAAARRSRDLWFGSYLLSEVSKAAARQLKSFDANLIFPSATGDISAGSALNVSNKILAEVDDAPGAEQLEKIKAAAQAEIEKAYRSAQSRLGQRIQVRDELIQRQLSSLLEFYAVWLPYDAAEHEHNRMELEKLLSARKTTRDFAFYEGSSGLAKSSLDGFREDVLRHETRMPKSKLYEIKKGEQLDGVSLLKRLAIPSKCAMPAFDSTLDVAARPYRKRISAHPLYSDYLSFLQSNGLPRTDAHLYTHESRQLFDSDEDAALQAGIETRRKALHSVFGEPNPPYYAVLIGDGDSMGDAISQLPGIERLQTFSGALSNFAAAATHAAAQNEGCPIYSGGDDVVALLPLHTLVPAIEAIRSAFSLNMKAYPVTFTIGVAIAHALDPLSETLEAARRAEKRAKSIPGKNALALTVIPRSGAALSLAGPAADLLSKLQALDTAYLSKLFGFSLAHSLREFLHTYPAALDGILPALLERHLLKKDDGAAVWSFIARLLPQASTTAGAYRQAVNELWQAMLVARPLHRAVKESRL